MNPWRLTRFIFVLAFASIFCSSESAFAGRKRAFLVADADYGGSQLKFTIHDMQAIGQSLGGAQWDVEELLIDKTASQITRSFRQFLRRGKGDDFIIFGYAGHGFAVSGTDKNGKRSDISYLLPIKGDADSLEGCIKLQDLFDMFNEPDAAFGSALVLLDACRYSETAQKFFRREDRGFVLEMPSFTKPMVIFTACKQGEKSYEFKGIQHGLFSNSICEALRTNAADSNKDGRVDIYEFIDFVQNETARSVKKINATNPNSEQIQQTPQVKQVSDAPMLLKENHRGTFNDGRFADKDLRDNAAFQGLLKFRTRVLIKFDFTGCNMSGMHLQGVKLRQCIFKNADLRNVHFERSDLRQADFEGADLRGANLSFANISGANVRNANLAGTIFRRTRWDAVHFQEALNVGEGDFDPIPPKSNWP
jgi:uncharacterized protein YjbI with pentapeptide repeats